MTLFIVHIEIVIVLQIKITNCVFLALYELYN